MEALFVEILTGDHAQQQFGHEVRVVMPELASHANGFNPFSKMKRQRAGTMPVQRTRLFGKLGCIGGDQPTGLAHVRLVEVLQKVGGELEQAGTQVVSAECTNHGAGGVANVALHHPAQQFLLAAVTRVQGLLGAAGVLGYRIHAHLHALLGQQLAHGIEHALIACVEGNGEVGRIHAVDYTVQFRIVESNRCRRVCLPVTRFADPVGSAEAGASTIPVRTE
ncbi:UNVERIFIED_ORG: hypothetical protein J2W60_000828 [Stenotrophomonas maltophilia]|nr:hypothetical protein [Stenotrophomonas maltophilia]